ncbi:hypothetical protein [Agromyces soli]|uniref:DUF4440 domain-containing protein n=1 Tax=Agromyces soli TaxID=659012 RepID=A0ABY4AQP9_9MICO|nr:hypothetical protein [Agromyces soli]UOE25502.1 hypothetical protein MTP13_14340 [Agromyces soli]
MTMNWLTRAWATGGLDDEEWEAHLRAYRRHCAEVRPRLSGGAELLLDGINLHDAQIHSFEHGTDGSLAMRALIGDLQVGYSFIELTFVDAEVRLEAGRDGEELSLTGPGVEIHYDEIDVQPDGRFVHRVLLWPDGEYEVTFSALTEHRVPADPSDRRR